ncbi:MAG TPA: ASKHA domain-containing protein [Lachnospiraceae bacterium]|nr:ASKHA domain-containing protein [Lachnospiraceae bacterium]
MFSKGTRCLVCTGCGKCFGNQSVNTLSTFYYKGYDKKEGLRRERTSQAFFGYEKIEEADGNLVAVDIGTTTIAMQLRRMSDAAVLDVYTSMNPQRKYGGDILSRIAAAEEEKKRLDMMELVREVLKEGLSQFNQVKKMVIAGNTTMIHLLMGYDTSGLGRAPFTPQCLEEIHTSMFGVETVILPGVSAFIGGDITAGIYALTMERQERVCLLIDLGTNGEMVLGNRHKLLATATAAGPAFEGNADCFGTDLMDLTGLLLKQEILDETGLLADPYFDEGIAIGGVKITQQYIRQLQMAKAAICTGIEILCRKYGLEGYSEIDQVFLAGGMGYYLNPEAAAAIGLIPKALTKKTIAVGNAALEGAFLFGTCKLEKLKQIQDFNLAEEVEFEKRYIEHMNLLGSL